MSSAQEQPLKHWQRYFTFIFTATWIAAVANACQTKKPAKGEMTRVLFSAKIPHWPPTCSLLSLPSSLDCSALLLTAFSAQDSTTKCLAIPQIFVLCYKRSILGQITPELDQFVRENKERWGYWDSGSVGESEIRNEGEVGGGIPLGAAFPQHIRLYQEQERREKTGTDKGCSGNKESWLCRGS